MAAKPTPSVMPRKYLPSRVNFSFRGGRSFRRMGIQLRRFEDRESEPGSVARRAGAGSDRRVRVGSEGSLRGTESVAIATRLLERHRDARDHLTHGPLGFVPGGD